ncbi:MAG: zinc ABC transporter substrate-binding protein, partial [Candidatus Thermoplasmatota archaeon]|nr:zinc ABC transporter substrate-binding protein [Candidatus Thermoplasmatota archaeon]
HDEDGHDEDGHDEDGHDEAVCHNTETHENTEHTNKEDCEAAGHMWMDDHDDHGDEAVCHNTETHENTEHTTKEDCEAAGHMWMEGHDDHEEPNDGTRGYLTIHVEVEGEYGFAVPSDISVSILMGDGHEGHDHGSHEGHDDHSGHDDDGHDEDGHDEDGHDEDGHDEDGHDEDGHDEDGDSTIVADEDEEAFDYDPHSWLDPISFKAQAQLVLDALIEVFPNGSETFTANANAFMAELDKIHVGYVGAFGPSGTCTNKTAAANHNAYSYITERYGVEFVTVHGLDPEAEPTLADIDKVVSKINEDEINVLFIEEYTQASSVDLIVQATNVQVMYLYTMEKAPSDVNDDYLSMMNKNLDNLMTGLGCAV